MRKLIALFVVFSASSAFSMELTDLYGYKQVMSVDDKEMLVKSTNAVGIGCGYDTKYETDVFFFLKGNSSNGGEAQIRPVLDQYTEAQVENLVIQTYRINETVKYLQKHFKRIKKWSEYYYFNNDLLLASDQFFQIIDNYYKNKYSANYAAAESKKVEAARRGILLMQEKETLTDSYR